MLLSIRLNMRDQWERVSEKEVGRELVSNGQFNRIVSHGKIVFLTSIVVYFMILHPFAPSRSSKSECGCNFIWCRHMLNWHSYCIDCAIDAHCFTTFGCCCCCCFFVHVLDFRSRIDSQFLFCFIDLEMDLHMCVCICAYIFIERSVYVYCTEHANSMKKYSQIFSMPFRLLSLFFPNLVFAWALGETRGCHLLQSIVLTHYD